MFRLILESNDSAKLMGKQVWQAQDGALFDSEEECLRHERASLFLVDMNNSDQYRKHEERWGLQENFSRYFLAGFNRIEDFWNYADSFKTLGDILAGKRPDLPKDMIKKIPAASQAKRKLLPSAKRRRR